jgi:hypothetical protein
MLVIMLGTSRLTKNQMRVKRVAACLLTKKRMTILAMICLLLSAREVTTRIISMRVTQLTKTKTGRGPVEDPARSGKLVPELRNESYFFHKKSRKLKVNSILSTRSRIKLILFFPQEVSYTLKNSLELSLGNPIRAVS